jgi:hypothetical protein
MKLKYETLQLFQDSHSLTEHIRHALYEKNQHEIIFPEDILDAPNTSAVLLLLGNRYAKNGSSPEPCLILNKRSRKIRQAGDLCCPGGNVALRLDYPISKLLSLPFSPLTRWPYWSRWRIQRPREADRLALFFATGLRESLEEMLLNPLAVKFLGPLPAEQLLMRKRIIFPMAGWISRQKRFVPNREVEKIVYVPLKNLLNSVYYARYELQIDSAYENEIEQTANDACCFLHQNQNESELLWGATYRIVMTFLELVFGFQPPEAASLPVVSGILDDHYFTGRS